MSEPREHWQSRVIRNRMPVKQLDGSWKVFEGIDDISPTTGIEAMMREAELAYARERARLTVLNLTPKDKRFLRALKIAV